MCSIPESWTARGRCSFPGGKARLGHLFSILKTTISFISRVYAFLYMVDDRVCAKTCSRYPCSFTEGKEIYDTKKEAAGKLVCEGYSRR
uniref:Uncharacterized protein n=1 Tax=viral metagenome TaxID=1070528 RepID=A0A6M3MF79_9ZZZZ